MTEVQSVMTKVLGCFPRQEDFSHKFLFIRKKGGAGDETRTRDINLGKVALYQLSYTRI
jgi:hypothetical protein